MKTVRRDIYPKLLPNGRLRDRCCYVITILLLETLFSKAQRFCIPVKNTAQKTDEMAS